MKQSLGEGSSDVLMGLTSKQCEVLNLLIEHQTSKEISRKLGISPHTVDQRILLARAKLNVASRSEVAQMYRRLLDEQRENAVDFAYDQSIYGSPDIAPIVVTGQSNWREEVVAEVSGGQITGQIVAEYESGAKAQAAANEPSRTFYHVLPEAFDGSIGTLMRLGAIATITAFLTVVILGVLAIFSELSRIVDF